MIRMGSMNNLEESRKQLNRLMRAHLHGEIDTQTFRNLTYAFSVMLSYFKTETEQPKEDQQQQAYNNFLEVLGRLMGKDQSNNDEV